MNYKEALQYADKAYGPGFGHGRELLPAVLGALGRPQDKIKVIHVAGTNGKGSVCAMLASVLKEAGFKTGLFTSPHLVRPNERFRINGEMISDEEFACQAEKVMSAEESLRGEVGLSYFDIFTAMAFSWFFDRKTDYAIVEVGMGGRLDPTNIITAPVMSVIASIGLDHTKFLGATVEEIAYEKAGIIKNNCPSVLYLQSEAVYNVVSGVAKKRNSELFYDRNRNLTVFGGSTREIRFSVKSDFLDYPLVSLNMPGEFQVQNAALVLLALNCLNKYEKKNISAEIILRGLEKTNWHCRFEQISENPVFITDGAHNPDAARAFASSVRKYLGGKRVILLVGIMKDKACAEIMEILSGFADGIVITAPPGDSRAASPGELFRAVISKDKLIITEADYKRAADTALAVCGEDGAVVCCGSLYIAGAVREYINNKNLHGGLAHDRF